jgi:hypothetical protein
MATDAPTQPMWPATAADALELGAFAAGAVALAGEAAVHVQQYFDLFHEVSWIGPLFLARVGDNLDRQPTTRSGGPDRPP